VTGSVDRTIARRRRSPAGPCREHGPHQGREPFEIDDDVRQLRHPAVSSDVSDVGTTAP
jgi:hypothetical protein